MSDSETVDQFLNLETATEPSPANQPEHFTEKRIVDLICQLGDTDPDHLIPQHITTIDSEGHKILISAAFESIISRPDNSRLVYYFLNRGHHDGGDDIENPIIYTSTLTPLNQAEVEFYYDYLRGHADRLPRDDGIIAGPSTEALHSRIRPLASDETIDCTTQSRAKLEVIARYQNGRWQSAKQEIPLSNYLAEKMVISKLLARTQPPTTSPN